MADQNQTNTSGPSIPGTTGNASPENANNTVNPSVATSAQQEQQASTSGASSTRANANTTATTTTPLIEEPFLECRSRRNANEIQTIAFNRIRNAQTRSSNAEWLDSLTKYTVRESMRMLVREYNNAIIAHNELYSLAMSKDARETQKQFFDHVSVIYHDVNEALMKRHDELADALHFSHADSDDFLAEPNLEPAIVEERDRYHARDEVPSRANPPADKKPEINLEIDGKFTMKTEPIKLPVFNGDKENWILFREQFLTFVHNRKLDNAIKMQQLFAHLSERAARVIKGITPVASNYERAWKVLNDRYNNNQILVNHHLKRFFNLQPLTKDDPSRLITMVDGVNELINSLPGIGEPMTTWDAILIFCVFNKLDHASQEAWKIQCMAIEKPSLHTLMMFLERRAQTNAAATSTLLTSGQRQEPRKFVKRAGVYNTTSATRNFQSCKLCGEEHPLYRCIKFRELAVKNRWQKAKDCHVCVKCLSVHDPRQKCNFEKCPVCSKPHNRLLCYDDEKRRQEAENESTLETTIRKANVNHIVLKGDVATILGTAEVEILNTVNPDAKIRCLCDSGSQLNLVTEETVRKLGLQATKAKIQLNGVGDQSNGTSNGIVSIRLGPNFGGRVTLEAMFFVVNKITMPLPVQQLPTEWIDSSTIGDLADPKFHQPAKIDALLGVNIWAAIVQPGIRCVADNLIGQKTKFGWVLYGSLSPIRRIATKRKAYVSATLTEAPVTDVMANLNRFWEVEESPRKKLRTEVEARCEEHFMRTHYRTSGGRYGIRLPFNELFEFLGKSRESAKRQFLSQEKRLMKNPEIQEQYIQFMREYLQNGHMSLAKEGDDGYYTPHHCVVTSKKFRTVFNASCPTDTGLSLNGVQMVGEKLQDDLAVLLQNFRRYPIAITADIKKMYRQIEVHPHDRKYQKIFWREAQTEPLMTYELNTVTYGQAAAPHCAVRALQQCAMDYQKDFPMGAQQALRCFYMDDYLGGADDIQSARNVRYELENLLNQGGFELAKWCSNRKDIVANDKQKEKEGIPCEDPQATSILGLRWMPESDVFTFQIATIEAKLAWTKREVMSEVGRLYDPTGFASPIIISAKLIIQKIWQAGGEWDQPIPADITEEWNDVIDTLPSMNDITIPRWLNLTSSHGCTLFGFCDASEVAYAAAVYMRTSCFRKIDGDDYISLLVQSKSKVAPLKQKYTVPRMELLAAELLAGLMEKVREIFAENVRDCYYWSDSRIALSWIRKEPALLKGLEANRVNNIRQKSDPTKWFYVPTFHNPADLATRARNDFIRRQNLWFYGPRFMSRDEDEWDDFGIDRYLPPGQEEMKIIQAAEKQPDEEALTAAVELEQTITERQNRSFQIYQDAQEQLPSLIQLFPDEPDKILTKEEIKQEEDSDNEPSSDLVCAEACVNVLVAPKLDPLTRTVINEKTRMVRVSSLLETYSDVDKLINVISYLLRAFKRDRQFGPLTPEERKIATTYAIREQQQELMPLTTRSIQNGNSRIREKPYRDLTLFLDNDDLLIHLDGRIRNPSIPYIYKNPIVLPPDGLLTRRIFEKAHRKTYHGGAQQILGYVRQQFWVPKARQLAKEIVHACVVCKRHSFKNAEQQMAPLPLTRTTPSRAFSSIGVDYCGPVQIKVRPGRTNIILKAYICVFVCLVTRAVHLELVSDMTTQAFIAAFRRLVARRGQVKEIVSDHGTNFVGAHNEFKRLKEHLIELSNYPFANEFNLKWRFNTERASHHGGIFEAAVKSAKRHLIRVIGLQSLTFEEYTTILTQVEGCLNSRPICKQSDDPTDLEPLTPAHFLIGEPIIVFPNEDLSRYKPSYLNRWEMLQQITNGFWQRWSTEYLNTLLNRPKWNSRSANFQSGDLVIIKEDNLPPSRWRLGRVVETIAGTDGLVRSVVLKTQFGKVRRPIVKLALLEREVEDTEREDRIGGLSGGMNPEDDHFDRFQLSD